MTRQTVGPNKKCLVKTSNLVSELQYTVRFGTATVHTSTPLKQIIRDLNSEKEDILGISIAHCIYY